MNSRNAIFAAVNMNPRKSFMSMLKFQYALNCLKRKTLYVERWKEFEPLVENLFSKIDFFDDVYFDYSCVVCLDDKRFPIETLISI
jgi:hypothetical protein